jgi:uncharacterized ion transporter superfamily protein YfcC
MIAVGELYFFQAILVAIPALYFAVTSLLIVALALDSYSYFLTPYLYLFLLMIVIEVLAFIVPMWSFHKDMEDQKLLWMHDTDTLARQIVTEQAALKEAHTHEEVVALNDQLAAHTSSYRTIKQMPTWPVNASTTWRFVGANVSLFVPILIQPFAQGFINSVIKR